MQDNIAILPKGKDRIEPQPINLLKFFKIWFGPMPAKIQQRLISIKNHSPQAEISLFWGPAYLDEINKVNIKTFAKKYSIALIDLASISATH